MDKVQKSQFKNIWLVTNGKRTEDALRLAELAKMGKVKCGLSQDEWHESISNIVVASFTIPRISYQDKRFVLSIGKYHDPIKHGRCDWTDRVSCNACGKPFVTTNGDIKQCGCLDSPTVGNVFDGFNEDVEWVCHKGLGDPNRDPRKKRVA